MKLPHTGWHGTAADYNHGFGFGNPTYLDEAAPMTRKELRRKIEKIETKIAEREEELNDYRGRLKELQERLAILEEEKRAKGKEAVEGNGTGA